MIALATLAGDEVGAQNMRVQMERPPATRGGVILVPVGPPSDGSPWPTTLKATLDTGELVDCRLLWFTPRPVMAERSWATTASPVKVRSADPDGGAIAGGIAHVAIDLAGAPCETLEIGGSRVRPVWFDAAPPAGRANPLVRTTAPDRPDPDSPFEHWRWELLAERLELQAPDPPGDIDAQLVARYYASLWRAGLVRLQTASPGVATACRRLLTQTCTGPTGDLAAWIADPNETAALLAILLDPRLEGERLLQAALSWADGRDPLFMWPQATSGDRATIAIANPTYEDVVARVRWLEGDEVPLGVPVPAGRLELIAVDRSPADEPATSAALAGPRTLVVQMGDREARIEFPPRVLTVQPPGLTLGPFRAPLTLADARSGGQVGIPANRQTLALVRRVANRWELYVEAFRPRDAWRRDGAPGGDGPGEGLILIVSDDDGPLAELHVDEGGAHALVRGQEHGSLALRGRSYVDRWRCRIVLPEQWLPAPFGRPAFISLQRTHADSTTVESATVPITPWAPVPPGHAISLDGW